jgi:hypothetical protein
MKTTIFAVTFAEINDGEIATNAPILCSSFEMAVVEMLLDMAKAKENALRIDKNEYFFTQVDLKHGHGKMVYLINPDTNRKCWKIKKMEVDISILIE